MAQTAKYMITMHYAFQMLEKGLLSAGEFQRFFGEMDQKYKCEEVRILYQSKLDMFLDQSVNGDTKGGTTGEDNKNTDKMDRS